MVETKTAPSELQKMVDATCVDAALQEAAMPLIASRFEIIPSLDGGTDRLILVLGGILSGQREDNIGNVSEFVKVTMHGAYSINRNLAADMIVKIQSTLNLSEDDLAEARVRNKIIPSDG